MLSFSHQDLLIKPKTSPAGTGRRRRGKTDINPTGELLIMKFVTAIIKPFKLDEVREALSAIGVRKASRLPK